MPISNLVHIINLSNFIFSMFFSFITLKLLMGRETEIRKLILQTLKRFPLIGDIWQNDSGSVGRRKKANQFRPNGLPDIMGYFKSGRAIYIEVKAPKGRRSPEQISFIERAKSRGCFAMFAEGVDEVLEALKTDTMFHVEHRTEGRGE